MNARFRLPIVALCIAGVLAGCGSVTSGLTFQPPAGWTGTPAMFGRLQMWIKGSDKKDESPQMLMLVKGDAKDTHSDFSAIPSQYGKDMKVLKHGKTTLCGTQAAEEFAAQGSDKDGKREQIEMTTTVIGNDRYFAMYIRPVALAADPQAENAIHSLCPTK